MGANKNWQFTNLVSEYFTKVALLSSSFAVWFSPAIKYNTGKLSKNGLGIQLYIKTDLVYRTMFWSHLNMCTIFAGQ